MSSVFDDMDREGREAASRSGRRGALPLGQQLLDSAGYGSKREGRGDMRRSTES
jgi:hypothetical protein